MTPHEVATGEKLGLLQLYEWGTLVWVKTIDVGKLDIQAEEGCFVGYDDELKGLKIYWPKQRKVSIECNVYVDKTCILCPDEVLIEGVEDFFQSRYLTEHTEHHHPMLHLHLYPTH